MDYSYLPGIKKVEMQSANRLIFEPYNDTTSDLIGWDNQAYDGTSKDYAVLDDLYVAKFQGGATYDIFSHSFFDPFILTLYDKDGDVVAIDNDKGSYGTDIIFNFEAEYTGDYYINASWDQGIYYNYVSISVYEDLDTISSFPEPTPEPTPEFEFVFGTNDNDVFEVEYGKHIAGGQGDDRIIIGFNRNEVTMENGFIEKKVITPEGVFKTSTIEYLEFEDGVLSFDDNSEAAEIFRLYEASFNREPDSEGLGYWIDTKESGLNLQEIAQYFINSEEFTSKYGNDLSDDGYITNLYFNVLDRQPDDPGYDYWLDKMNSGADKADLLVSFSESQENIDNTSDQIQTEGMWLI